MIITSRLPCCTEVSFPLCSLNASVSLTLPEVALRPPSVLQRPFAVLLRRLPEPCGVLQLPLTCKDMFTICAIVILAYDERLKHSEEQTLHYKKKKLFLKTIRRTSLQH